MRNINQIGVSEPGSPQTGSLLVAHPSLRDPNFRQAVVFLAAHDPDGGSMGVVMNQSTGKTLGQCDPDYAGSTLTDLPVCKGGPVAADQIILVAWRYTEEEGTFQLYFGIDRTRAEQLIDPDSGFEVKAFIGHSGWSEGQLEEELEQDAWILSRWLPELTKEDGVQLWRNILLHEDPAMLLLLNEPEDPSLN